MPAQSMVSHCNPDTAVNTNIDSGSKDHFSSILPTYLLFFVKMGSRLILSLILIWFLISYFTVGSRKDHWSYGYQFSAFVSRISK